MAEVAFDPVQALPAELLALMWSFLPPPQLARARGVSRAWAGAVAGDPAASRRMRHCQRFCHAEHDLEVQLDWTLEEQYWFRARTCVECPDCGIHVYQPSAFGLSDHLRRHCTPDQAGAITAQASGWYDELMSFPGSARDCCALH